MLQFVMISKVRDISPPMKIYFADPGLRNARLGFRQKGNNKYYIQSAFALPDAEKKMQEERSLLGIGDSLKK